MDPYVVFNGHPDHAHRVRENVEELLSFLKVSDSIPWLCMGDFNEIIAQSEKSGGIPRNERQMERFHSILEDYHLGILGIGVQIYMDQLSRGWTLHEGKARSCNCKYSLVCSVQGSGGVYFGSSVFRS
ncbi:hypothetical protein SLA2020_390020 [Shorea laevis]